jgi:membrane-bound lytic murein transglycosylase D|tara:strand:+ start:852 stop:3062 length:2211 start_codon:yes stop_codon:yes gene_type:complete
MVIYIKYLSITKLGTQLLHVKTLYRMRYVFIFIFVLQNSLLGTVVHAQQLDSSLFPRPAELEPAIEFWIRVYTEVDTSSGFLHDSENLAIIYAELDFDNLEIDVQRQKVKNALLMLASGKRTDLTANQENILNLWPDGVSDQTLKKAANNVRWQLGQSNSFLDGLQRSGAYRSHIDEILQNRGLPPELALLPHVESSFNPEAYSHANAAGMWQFTRLTGQRFMRIDHFIDERMDPYIAADAAMSLLEYNYRILGTWPLALTAYNHGVGGMSRAVRENNTTAIDEIVTNYKGRAFGFAGRNFYAQFLAVNEIERDVDLYFQDIRLAIPPNFTEVRLDSFIGARDFATSVGTTINQLRVDNPSLRNAVWQGVKRIPRGFRLKLRAEEFPNGSELLTKIDNDYKYSDQLPDNYYEVERGDNLNIIADKLNTTISEIANLNQLRSQDSIQIGQRLMLPLERSPNLNASSNSIASIAVISPSALNNDTPPSNPIGIPPSPINQPPGKALSEDILSNSIIVTREIINNEPILSKGNSVENSFTSLEPIPENSLVTTTYDQLQSVKEQSASRSTLNRIPKNLGDEITAATNNIDVESMLETDPANYFVDINGNIEAQASETIGRLANWLDIRAWDIRRLNNMNYRDQIFIGKKILLDFNRISIADFEIIRRNFHSNLQRDFFDTHQIKGSEEHEIGLNDNINRLAKNTYSAPLWLVRQYNPDFDFNRIQVGQKITFPLLEITE